MRDAMMTGNRERAHLNRGVRPIPPPEAPAFPDMGDALARVRGPERESGVDVMLVNPPAPDGGIWIRSQHRVGRRSREGMIWPQVSLAQIAAMLHPDYTVEVVDAIATRMDWGQFEALIREKRPRYYITQVTAPTLLNDMYGTFLAKTIGARTVAFGTHVTPMPRESMRDHPTLDFVLRGEPELTVRELIDTLEERPSPGWVREIFREADGDWAPVTGVQDIKGLVWRQGDELIINAHRPFIADLDKLPLPMHRLLPLRAYRIPMLKGPYTFVVTSRGCPARCRFCIKHVNSQQTVRVRSPENIMRELRQIVALGIRNIHMYADLFTVSRDQVMGLCRMIIDEGLDIRWTCNSRVDYVDAEMLDMMARAGCWLISWGIESGSEKILRHINKGYPMEQVENALRQARRAGIKNWGYFIIGLPGETEATIRQTVDLAKRLPLDLALFHIAAPHPGTPFFMEVIDNGWFRPGTSWEDVDMDRSTVLDYPNLTAEQLEQHARRAFREWALRPGPILNYLRGINSLDAVRLAVGIGIEQLKWVLGRPINTLAANPRSGNSMQ
jgi:anaerobic magnesium-protoporphyrin IX monomethyl ester cyclase